VVLTHGPNHRARLGRLRSCGRRALGCGRRRDRHGHLAYFWGLYSQVEPHRRLGHGLSYSQDQTELVIRDDDAPRHDIVIDVEARDAGMWARSAQYGQMPADQAAMAQAGMENDSDFLGGTSLAD